MSITTAQKENIQIDFGIIYTNYGETDAAKLAPVRGGGEFSVDIKIRDIEFDGSFGKTKGMQVIDEIDATLKCTVLDTSIKTLAIAMPYATLAGAGTTESPYTLTCKSTDVGVIADASYLKNVTMFAKTLKGEFRKITLYNAMAENKFGFKAVAKKEGEIQLEFNGHWDPTDDTKDLYKIETVTTITA
jgi:hypothetical protein